MELQGGVEGEGAEDELWVGVWEGLPEWGDTWTGYWSLERSRKYIYA